MPRTQPRWRPLLLIATLAAAGCRTPDPTEDLELVQRAAETEPGAAPRYLVLGRTELAAGADDGSVEMWLPLPRTDAHQTVQSLAVEVGPSATYAVEEQDGERLLHVAAPGPTPVAVRALVEHSPRTTALPPALADLPAGDADAWVQAATARGATARVVNGVAPGAEGQTVAAQWPEVLVDGDWTPAQPAGERVRLGPGAARATLDGRPVEVRTSWVLERR